MRRTDEAPSRLAAAFTGSQLGLRRGVVELAPYSPEWVRAFTLARDALVASAPEDVTAIEHIGSTSVPGLAAKPILDVAIAVRSDVVLDCLDEWLQSMGMMLRGGANELRPDRMFGYELEPMVRLANVHLVHEDSADLRRYLAFRDYLRTHPGERDAYAALKHSLAEEHVEDRVAYVDAKAAFIVERRGDGEVRPAR